jgi:hypothetical protein
MKKLTTLVVGFSVVAASATLFVWWDTSPTHAGEAKYKLGVNSPGPEIRYPMPAGPPLRSFYCDPASGEKNCGTQPAVVHTVPTPGTLWLLGLGLLGAWWSRHR